MKFYRAKFLLFCLLVITPSIRSTQTISFFMRPYPDMYTEQTAERFRHKLEIPGKIAKYSAEYSMPEYLASGIFCSYAGYLTVSDLDGQVIFPRQHEASKFKLLITTQVTPVVMHGNTLHHFEVQPTIPTAYYSAQRLQDPDVKTYLWNVKKKDLPENRRIGLDTIIIFAKPKDIYVPEGVTLSLKRDQLIFPDIYVKAGINKASSAIYILNLENFFSTPNRLYKKFPDKYQLDTSE